MTEEDTTTRTVDIVTAFVSNNAVAVHDLPRLIRTVHEAVTDLTKPAKAPEPELVPAVPIRASVKPDHVTCLECGYKGKMLKRHIGTAHGLTDTAYRERWSLAADHALVAPNYAARRRDLALSFGLGRKTPAKTGG